MHNIICKFFGYPKIREDEKDIHIPSGKLTAFLYYILMKKIVSRDEVAGMFWAESTEENAKISLRNALHKIRKTFKSDIILSPNKSILVLNEEINIDIDVKKFEQDPYKNLDLYAEDFLKGFYIKDAIEFDYWCTELNSFYRESFIKNSEKKIKDMFENKNKNIESLISKLLSIDNFNETAYTYLMKFYKINNRYDKVINEYHHLHKLMNEELGINPSKEIENIYNESIKFINRNKNNDKDKVAFEYYSREYEYSIIQKNLDDFQKERAIKSVFVTGESGVGKTILKNHIIEKNNEKFIFYEVFCYKIEERFSFSPWTKIIKLLENDFQKNNIKRPYLWDQLLKNIFFDSVSSIQPSVAIVETKENFNMDLIYSTLSNAFELLNFAKKMIIIFEDIQWADLASINLLIRLILNSNNRVLFFLTESNEMGKNIENIFLPLKDLEKISIVELKRFDRREVEIITKKILGDKITEEGIEEIYKKSKGNAFFLREYIELFKNNEKNQNISSKMYNILDEKFSNLEEQELNILRMISAFYGDVSLDLLLKILDVKAFDILKSINLLSRLNIIEEKKEDTGIIFRFTYSAFKDYIYSKLSEASKQIINKEIAKILEIELSNNTKDITIYNKLRYHYKEAKEEIETLKYDVHILNYYLNFNHEIYPNLDDYDLTKQVKLQITNEKVLNWIYEIEKTLLYIKNSKKKEQNIKDIMSIELLFLYCKGRYLVRIGSYSEGVSVINRVIRYSRESQEQNMEIAGYKQMIIYGIQINNSKIMLHNIIKGIKVAKISNKISDMGVFYRLYGVYYLMIGETKSAEALFNKSISIFLALEKIESKNSISIAANYNYIGEIRKSEGRYHDALEYFNSAIDLCKKSEATCLSIFYINAGKTNFLIGNYIEMKKYFLLAEEIVMKFDSYWRVAVLDSFLSLIYFIERDYLTSLQYLKDAISERNIINNSRDIGIIYFVEAIISDKIKNEVDPNSQKIKEFLTENSKSYYYNAIKYLDYVRDQAEIKYLRENFID
ncbi:serine/threonine protein kinase [Fusobacterium necrophorum DAB]|uniref:AAA family ATPase n=1 Tax=Fusobacterium necrophorum TaxID=859 RepID=UPI000460C2AE|nr:AAA family ATPase [Fusobacterium necrophorum]KDE70363.1 serine/threonine protein kinase [Fusobacterium necrophorum DAB]